MIISCKYDVLKNSQPQTSIYFDDKFQFHLKHNQDKTIDLDEKFSTLIIQHVLNWQVKVDLGTETNETKDGSVLTQTTVKKTQITNKKHTWTASIPRDILQDSLKIRQDFEFSYSPKVEERGDKFDSFLFDTVQFKPCLFKQGISIFYFESFYD